MMTYFCQIFIAAIVILILYSVWALQYWTRKGIPTIPFYSLFVYTKDVFLQRMGPGCFFKEMYFKLKDAKKSTCIGGTYFLLKPVLVLLSPDVIKQVLVRDFESFTDHGSYINEEKDPLTGILYSMNGDNWKHLRSKLQPVLTSAKLKVFFQSGKIHAQDLFEAFGDYCQKREPLDLYDLMLRWGADTLGTWCFGIKFDGIKDPNTTMWHYGKMTMDKNFSRNIKNFLGLLTPKVLKLINVSWFGTEISEFFLKTVKETVDYRERNNIRTHDLLDFLMQVKRNFGVEDQSNYNYNFTIDKLAAQAFMFFTAGFETSSKASVFLIYELAINSDLQDRVRKEITNVLRTTNGEVTYESLSEMPLLDACICETLRKHPSVPMLQRVCTKEYKIPNTDVVIEKDTLVVIPVYAIHNDPEYYPRPEIFDPDRFSGNNKYARESFLWLPFGEGPRVCIGMPFGRMQIKLAIVTILKSFRLFLHPKTKTPVEFDTLAYLLSPKETIWIGIEKI